MLNHHTKLVKTTIDLPEELIDQAKITAIKFKTSLKNVFTISLRQYLSKTEFEGDNINFTYSQDQINHFFGILHDKRRISNKTDKQLVKEAVNKKFKAKK